MSSRIEDPIKGDPQRGLVSSILMPVDGVNFLTELPNRGKLSVDIDIKTPEGRELIYRMVDDADVFVTNYLPDVRQRLGIDVKHIRAPSGIVYVRGSALDPKGRILARRLRCRLIWARGGIASAQTRLVPTGRSRRAADLATIWPVWPWPEVSPPPWSGAAGRDRARSSMSSF